MRAAVWLAAVLASAAAGADLPARVAAAIEGSGAGRSAFWGIRAVDLESGKTVYDLNGERLFIPASTTKLFTTALALARLGPEHRFQTLVAAEGPPDAAGTVTGLRIVGGGDPGLSGRTIPYRHGAAPGDPLGPIEDLAGQVVARGVRRVRGGITGDDSAWVREPFPAGWAVDDPTWEYGAAVSALAVNDNSTALRIRPGARPGELARVSLSPELGYFQIDNRVRTVKGGEERIRLERDPGSRQVRIWGTVRAGGAGVAQLLGVDDPARFAALALKDALERRGVTVEGGIHVRHLSPDRAADPRAAAEPGFVLARRVSAPLVEHLRTVNKVSQNLHAEMALRAVAQARRGVGSREGGIEEMKLFLEEAGIEPGAWHLEDGSGLARRNLISPAALTRLLSHMWAQPTREAWLGLLPVGGEDGTLAWRFRASPAAARRIRAKTGSLAHVAALAGYAERAGGGRLAFAIMVNNYSGAPKEILGAIDRICLLLVE